MHGWQCRPI